MNEEYLLSEIKEANLTYLMLAQALIRQDRASAVFRLGLNEDSCNILAKLTSSQLLKLASRNDLLCTFRVEQKNIWNLLANESEGKINNATTNTLHANILMASQVAEVL